MTAMQKYRAKQKANGLCVSCGQKSDGRVNCPRCRKADRARKSGSKIRTDGVGIGKGSFSGRQRAAAKRNAARLHEMGATTVITQRPPLAERAPRASWWVGAPAEGFTERGAKNTAKVVDDRKVSPIAKVGQWPRRQSSEPEEVDE